MCSIAWSKPTLPTLGAAVDHQEPFIALLYGKLEGATSLREIEAGLESHKGRLYHLSATPPSRGAGRCQCAAPRRGVQRTVRGDRGAGPSSAAPRCGRDGLSD